MRNILIIFLIPISCIGQQDPLSGLYWNNYAHYNPATSGLENQYDGYVSYRNQWQGVNGAPVTLFANANTCLKEHHGLGINYIYDKIGFTASQILNANYNYQFLLKNEQKLSLGAAAGIDMWTLNPEWIPPQTLNDPTLPGAQTNYYPNFNAGIAYLSKAIYVGAGFNHLNQSRSGEVYIRMLHSYFHTRFKLALGPQSDFNKRAYICISGILRTDWIKSAADFDVRVVLLKNRLWVGGGYRTTKTMKLHLAWDFKEKYRIAYGFENFGAFDKLDTSTHEFTIGFKIPYQKGQEM